MILQNTGGGCPVACAAVCTVDTQSYVSRGGCSRFSVLENFKQVPGVVSLYPTRSGRVSKHVAVSFLATMPSRQSRQQLCGTSY